MRIRKLVKKLLASRQIHVYDQLELIIKGIMPAWRTYGPPTVRSVCLSLALIVFTFDRAGAGEQQETRPASGGEKSGSNFLELLSQIVADGELRNLDRFARILHVAFTLAAVNSSDDSRVDWVSVLPKTDRQPFVPPLFRYALVLQDAGRISDKNDRTIATMTFEAMNLIACITKEDIARKFNSEPVEIHIVPPSESLSYSFLLAKDRGYETFLVGYFAAHNHCVGPMTILQVIAAPPNN